MKLTFALTSYQDADLALKSIAALQRTYPGAAILHLSDLQVRLKLPQFAGQWTERWMKAALATDADIIVKVDPDTRAYAAAQWPGEDIFGQRAVNGTYWNVKGVLHGAAIGFKRSAVEKIVSSGLLRDVKYTKHPYVTSRDEAETISLQDPMVHDIAQRLGLTEGEWDGLAIRTKWDTAPVIDERKTFIHPVKD
jgi:hypothetical protein